MMHHVAICADSIPKKLSSRSRFRNCLVILGFPAWIKPLLRSSSTSSEASQKNIYGEIVVPITPVMMKKNEALNSMCGINVAFRTVTHGTWTRNTVMT